MENVPKYRRVLLKLSGEVLVGKGDFGIDHKALTKIAEEIEEIHQLQIEMAVVIGGGNIFRGGAAKYMDRIPADYMGMLATVINALALQEALEKRIVDTRVMTSIEMKEIAEPYIRRRAIRHLEKGRVVVFAAGTGSPYFTTDTAASLRATEINAQIILKATKVDGVYNADPMSVKNAKKFNRLTYMEVLKKHLKVMDATAISLCMDHNIPIVVFDLAKKGNMKKAVMGRNVGTIIRG